jgi:hypothetical protein
MRIRFGGVIAEVVGDFAPRLRFRDVGHDWRALVEGQPISGNHFDEVGYFSVAALKLSRIVRASCASARLSVAALLLGRRFLAHLPEALFDFPVGQGLVVAFPIGKSFCCGLPCCCGWVARLALLELLFVEVRLRFGAREFQRARSA